MAALWMAAVAVCTGSVSADTYTWSTNTTGAAADGSGTWNTTSANWVGAGDVHATWNNANGDTAAFGAGGSAGTVTVDAGGVTIGGLTFNAATTNGTYTLAGGPLALTGSPVFEANTNATIGAVIAGSVGFAKTGVGTLTVSSALNSFTGNVSVAQGVLIAQGVNNFTSPTNSALGYLLSATRVIDVGTGATLQFNAHDTFGNSSANPTLSVTVESGGTVRNNNAFTTFGPLNLVNGTLLSSGGANTSWQAYQLKGVVTSGGDSAITTTGGNYNGVHLYFTRFAVTNGTLTVSAPLINQCGSAATTGFMKTGDGAMVLVADNTFNGGVTVSNGVLRVGNGGATGSLGTGAGAVSLVNGNASLVFDRSGSTGVSGAISGSGSLVKKGSGIVTLSGANTYAGGTVVSNGVLAATTTNALPGFATAGKVVLSSGAGLSVGVGSWSVAEINALIATGVYGGGDKVFGFDTTAGNYTYSGQFALPAVAGIVKTGPNALTLSSSTGCAGGVTALGGILQADFGAGIPAMTNVTLWGASLSSTGTLSAALGTAPGQINMVSGTASGFSAVGVPLTVNLGGASASLSWGDSAFNPSALVLNDIGANTNLTFVNGLSLNGATRTINVNSTVTGAGATISGVIANGSGAAGLIKGGSGVLTLTAANTFTGGTTVNGGTLALAGGNDRIVSSGAITLNGAILDLGGGTQNMTSGSLTMNNGAAIQNGTIKYLNSSWSPVNLSSVTFGAGGGFCSANRLLMYGGQTLTLASGAGLSAFGGNGSDACNLIGVDNGTTNALVVNGGSLNFTNAADGAGYLRLAANGSAATRPIGSLTVNGGVLNVGHAMGLGGRFDNGASAAYGVASFTLNGGSVNLGTGNNTQTSNGNCGWLYLGNNTAGTASKSTVSLNGGTLSLVQLESGAYGTNTLTVNGGTLKARRDNATFVNGATLACAVGINGVAIDTAGFNVGIDANLTGIGSLTKRGNGALTLSGSNALAKAVSVEAGTLTLSSLDTPHLKLHLDASDVSTLFAGSDGTGAITASGQTVGYWGDQSGNGKAATQSASAKCPTYLTGADGFNGLPVLQFDGSDDEITSSLDINATNLPNATIFIVYRQLEKSGVGALWGHDDGAWDRMQLFYNSYDNAYYQIAASSAGTSVKGMATNQVTVYTAVLKNGVSNGSYVYINGVSDGATGLPAFTSTEPTTGKASFTLANKSSGDGFCGRVQIGEVLVYDAALSDGTRKNVEAYLKNKWTGASVAVTPVLQTGLPVSPTADAFNGLKLWLDVSTPSSLFTNATGVGAVTTSGQPVGYWGDLSGNGKPAKQSTLASRPAYVTNAAGFNGCPVLQFDGTDDDITSSLDFNATNLPNVTLFIVYKQLDKTGNAGLWGHDDGGWDRLQLLCNNGTYYQIATAGNAVSVKGMETNKVTLYTAVLRNGVSNGSYVYINGQSDATHGLPAFTSTESSGQANFTLGNISSGNGYRGAVQIGEVMVFDSVLSDLARANVADYLSAKWKGETSDEGVSLAAGSVLNLEGMAHTLSSVSGSGVISNGTLTVTTPLSPGGDGVVGTQTVANVALNGTLLIDVATDGTCDRLAGTGTLSLSGLTLKIANAGLLNRAKTYMIVTCSGTLTGTFIPYNLPDNWHLFYDYTAGTVTLSYVPQGTMIKVR
jgi:autotransporter-associated beta strand protein